ncbi:hypothetical protein D9613_002504 [Agrocybe pediades]|uniref:RING-type E3 ubiquitin transferase n=1 Tax=Agrocybe pediades TaxID=84607 RepID=A0A8H4VMV8_9AGAR|nr:hypothetical protein D9613_002504 [Agrocybe pediades]
MSAEVATQVRASTTSESSRGRRNNRANRGGASTGGGATSATANTTANTNTNNNNNNARGPNRNPRQGGRAGGGGGGKGRDKVQQPAEQIASKTDEKPGQDIAQGMAEMAVSEDGDIEICWICAEPVKYWAVSQCNHRTCHVCAIRLRALYKKNDCTFCKEPQPTVVFTLLPDALFATYNLDQMLKDNRLSAYFESQEMMDEALLLLRFNCADKDCDYIGNGWADLRLHSRATHGKLMCDLCIRHKKVFCHEHTLYTASALSAHLPSMNYRPGKAPPKEIPEGGIHPFCAFCRECYFGDDELYAHMREKHEECFICKRNEIKDKYFANYESLEQHFTTDHYPCTNSECQAQKFVVFNTPLDLKAHMVEAHGQSMNPRDLKEARKVVADFSYEQVNHPGRFGRRDRERDRDRDRDREPPPQPQASTSAAAGPSTTARPAGGNRRREGFGGALTTEGAGTSGAQSNSRQPSRPSTPQMNSDIDPAVAERHAAFLARLQQYAPNPTNAVTAVKAATRGYRSSETSARDLILTVWNVLDRHLDHTASIVNMFIDLLDDDEKKQDLLTSWKGFAVEQRRQFPDLTPTATGSAYAGITSGRVLNVKHSTATRSSQSQQVWNRVAMAASNSAALPPVPRPRIPAASLYQQQQPQQAQQAAASQEKFPVLGAGSSASGSGSGGPGQAPAAPAFRQGQRTTPWSASSAQPSGLRAQAAPTPVSVSMPSSSSSRISGKKAAQPPKLSSALFPELPSSSAARSKPQVSGNVSLRNILGGGGAPPVSKWGGAGGSGSGSGGNVDGDGEGGNEEDAAGQTGGGGGKGKKGKGKQKQTLFTLGSFPN